MGRLGTTCVAIDNEQWRRMSRCRCSSSSSAKRWLLQSGKGTGLIELGNMEMVD